MTVFSCKLTMETRRSQRQNSRKLTEKAAILVPDMKHGFDTKSATTKRKISDNTSTASVKRSAFEDLTNKKSSISKSIVGKSSKKTSQNNIDRDTNSLSSREKSRSLTRTGSESSSKDYKSVTTSSSKSDISTELLSVNEDEKSRCLNAIENTEVHKPRDNSCNLIPEDLNYNDIDKENENDIFQSPEYAQDIFNYYKSIEAKYIVDDYMVRQSEITPAMRAVLVDWLVEVQESFELNHETLYLAVRLVDHFLMKRVVTKESLQLVGAAAVFIGCKFDERVPPLVDDFLYICDDAYNRSEFVRMEKEILKVVDFNLGMPISYRFLRRFAKAGKKNMHVLTLARYINETALMSYKVIKYRESLIAAGCLYLAMKMMEPDEQWDDTLIYFTGYKEVDLKKIVTELNDILHNRTNSLQTVYTKYSHRVFFEVAKLPMIATKDLYPR